MATVTDDNQTSQSLTFLQRVQDIPLVNDGLSNAHSLIQSNTYSAAVYNKAGEVASTVYSATEPYQKRFEPQIKQVDGVLNKGFDFVQSKIPYPFEAKTDEVIAKARAPADHVYIVASGYAKAANERISPITEQIQAQVSKTLETIKPLQEKLQANLAAISSQSSQTASDAAAKVQAASNSIMNEVEGLLNFLKNQRQELPSHVQTSLQPFVEKLGTGYSDIKSEISKEGVPIATKAQNVLTYSKDNAIPLVNEALSSLKELVSIKSNEAGSKSGGISGPK